MNKPENKEEINEDFIKKMMKMKEEGSSINISLEDIKIFIEENQKNKEIDKFKNKMKGKCDMKDFLYESTNPKNILIQKKYLESKNKKAVLDVDYKLFIQKYFEFDSCNFN
jgi:hypothetical protein